MATANRNDPCPCGSGKKYKKCCAIKQTADEQSNDSHRESIGLKPAIRMKGGVMFDPESRGYIAIVHSWDNAECRGEPTEWRDPRVFASEDAAMQHYKSSIRPSLEKLMNQIKKGRRGVSGFHRKLEE
jgi:hypothetical protein